MRVKRLVGISMLAALIGPLVFLVGYSIVAAHGWLALATLLFVLAAVVVWIGVAVWLWNP